MRPPAPVPDCSEGSFSGQTHCQTFIKHASGAGAPIDILWVVDNSGSMGDEQGDLAKNFETFINKFSNQNQNADFKMGIITTDDSSNRLGSAFDSTHLQSDRTSFIDTFKTKIKVGISGSGYECGLGMSLKFLKEDESWVRNNAYFLVVYVSDENDRSHLPSNSSFCSKNEVSEEEGKSNQVANAYFQAIGALKPSMLFKAFSIVDTSNSNRLWLGQRYIKLAELSGGSSYSIGSDFSTIFQNFGQKVAEMSSLFQLKYPAKASAIEVYVDGSLASQSEWRYLPGKNAISFEKNYTPQAGSQIKVVYEIK